MQETRWWQRINLAYASVITAIVTGLMFPKLSFLLLIFLAIFSFWSIYQLQQLDRWLKSPEKKEPPESYGVWGAIFDKIYFLQKRERRARKDLQSIISRARQSANSLNDGVIIIKNDGTLEWWNRAANHLTGLKYPEDVGHQLTHLWRTPALGDYFNSKAYDTPLVTSSPQMTSMQLQIQISLFGKDDRLMVVRDITRLLHLEQMRTEFVANVSHELRTPLTVMKGYLESFHDQLHLFEAPIQRGLQQMQEQSQRMEALVNDLLLLSQLETSDHKDDQAPIDLRPLLEIIRNETEMLAEAMGHTVKLSMPDNIKIDIQGCVKELHSAFSNLTINAVKYTPEKGHIDIQVTADHQGGIAVAVVDDGNGIAAEHLPRLTERFYRADASRAQKTGGTGLGLAIVKHVLLRHGGNLEIESRLGKGSRFICRFPNDRINIKPNPMS